MAFVFGDDALAGEGVDDGAATEGFFGAFEGAEFVGAEAGVPFDGFEEIEALPGLTEVYIEGGPFGVAGGRNGDDFGPEDLAADGGEEGFDALHHAFEVGVGLIELEEGEFGVVAVADAFVAEDAAELEDAGDIAANDSLEGEL